MVVVRDDDIGRLVAGDVTDREAVRAVVARVWDRVRLLRAERPAARAAVHAGEVPAAVGDDHVGATVVGHVCDLDRLGDVAARVRHGGRERAARGLREHREPGRWPVAAVRGDDVDPPVAGDVADADALGEGAARDGGTRPGPRTRRRRAG